MQAVKAFIDSGEIAADELAELAFLNESVATTGAEEPAYNPQILKRTLDQLDGVAQAPPSGFLDRLSNPDSSSNPDSRTDFAKNSRTDFAKNSRTESAATGMFASLRERLQWSLTPPLARVAIAAQFALVLGLVVALTLGDGAGDGMEEAGFEVVSGAVAGDVTVAFAPSATAEQIRALLADNSASIVAGPSALGMYTLDLAEGVVEAEALAALQASAATTFVQPVPDP
jgi:hypothetical protein